MSQVKKSKAAWSSNLNRRQLVGLALLALVAAYFIGSRALDTASWWEYSYTFVLVIYAINRLIKAGHKSSTKKS